MEISTVVGEFAGRQRHWLAGGTLVSDEYLVDGGRSPDPILTLFPRPASLDQSPDNVTGRTPYRSCFWAEWVDENMPPLTRFWSRGRKVPAKFDERFATTYKWLPTSRLAANTPGCRSLNSLPPSARRIGRALAQLMLIVGQQF